MINFKNIILISFILLLTTTVPALSADFTDSFTRDFSTFKENFTENTERPDSIKNEIKKNNKAKKPDKESENTLQENVTEIDIKSEKLDYYADRHEVEAVGKASITTQDGSTLKADKLIYNQDTNIIKGYGNVRLIKDSNVMDGDFITIDLNESNALMTNPTAENMLIKLKAENASLIGGKDIMLENGFANVKDDRTIVVGNTNFSKFGTSELSDAQKVFYLKEKYDEKYVIKTKEIVIDAKGEHDTVTIRNADIFLKDMKVATAGKIKLITNKEQQYVETDMPEIGFLRQFGTYAGPGFSFEGPFGGAIKLVPLVNVFRGNVGAGGMIRYKNAKNITEFAMSSANESKAILIGEQDITDNMSIRYGMNGYQNEWFMGDRAPGGIAELTYRKKYDLEDIGVRFEHRLSGGIARDFDSHWSTARFRWMAQADKPIWYYGDDVNNRYAVFELSTQAVTGVYGNGDTLGLLRVGPRLRTETDRWIQTLGYFYTARHGDSPFVFDKYMYGTNNLYISEGLKLNKYLSVMWAGSLALNKDAWDGKLMQENRFFVMVGPEDIKFTLGYDTVRERTFFTCFMMLGTKNADLEFKKLYIKNPDKLGVSSSKETKAEKASLEAKAEIKPKFTDRLFNRTKPLNIEPEREEKIIIDENIQPITNKIPEHEIIVPQVRDSREIPKPESIAPNKFNSGMFRLHDEKTTPMLTPMIMPLQNMGY